VPASAVDEFVRQLPATLPVRPTIGTIGINAEDYEKCRRDIRRFEAYVRAGKPDREREEKGFMMPQNNIHFNRLLSLTDSVALMEPETIDSLLYHTSTLWSTTTNWTSIEFTLEDGRTLDIRNQYYEPNSLHFPWIVRLGGYVIARNMIAVNHFIETVYPNFLDHQNHADIVELFVKYLYNQ
jgi:hypothetical protein